MKRLRFFFRKLGINRKRPFLFGFLVLLCLGVTVGYAFLTTTLNINGAVNVASSRWDVHFENVQIKDGSVTATTAPTITDDTSIAFAATLENPGEFYEFIVDVVNDGTYDARISSLEITPVLTEDESKYFEYQVQYTTGFDVKEEDILLSGRRREIKVSVLYKTNEDDSVYPEEDKDFNFEIIVNYEQLGKNYNPCTYEGELTNGASYQNGQYTYTYNTSNNGWSVGLINRNSTDPVTTKLCTSINGKYIVSMSGMFSSSKANSIDLSSFDTSHVTSMSGMFAYASNIKNLDFSSFDTSNVTNMSGMFSGASSLETLDLSNFDTSNVTSLGDSFYNATSLIKLDISNWILPEYFSLKNLSNLKELNMTNVDASNVTNMSGMFSLDRSLVSLDLSSFDTSNVTDMSQMFYGCSSLSSINLSSFDTSNVTKMAGMFDACSSLSNLDLSHFNTSNVTDMWYIFGECSNLESINLSNWDFRGFSQSNVIARMVGGSSYSVTTSAYPKLEIINLTNTKYEDTLMEAFAYLRPVKHLILNDIDTSQINNMQSMFIGSNQLEEIDLSSFTFKEGVVTTDMFNGVTATVGYAKDQANADFLNSIPDKPSGLVFTVKS